MGIARAIKRVKRQAKQGGLDAVISGLGEGLRSRAVPAPLRGAARRIASLIDPTRSAPKPRHGSSAKHSKHAPREAASEIDPGVARPPEEVTPIGVDSGAEPIEAADGTPVDAAVVGATPTFNATPLEVMPVEVAPLVVNSSEVAPVEITLRDLPYVQAELDEESEQRDAEIIEGELAPPLASEQLKPHLRPAPKKKASKKPAPAPTKPKPAVKTPDVTKEKLAAAPEAAKSVARSGSRTAKKPASTRADTTSKKK